MWRKTASVESSKVVFLVEISGKLRSSEPHVHRHSPATRQKVQRKIPPRASTCVYTHPTAAVMSMITATAWVPRGFAAPFPSKYVFDEDEFDRISKLAKLQLDDAKEDLEDAQEEEKQKQTNGSSKPSGTANAPDTEYADRPAAPTHITDIRLATLMTTSRSMTSSTTTMTTRRARVIPWPFSAT